MLLAVGCESAIHPAGEPVPEPEAPRTDAGGVHTTDAGTAPPQLVSTNPRGGAVVYARRMFDSMGTPSRPRIELTLSAPLPVSSTLEVELAGGDDMRRLLAACEGPRCVVPVPEVEALDPRGTLRTSSFRYSTSYTATIDGLGSARPTFSFETLPIDESLEHTCMHTVDPNVITLGLADAPISAAAISLTHRRHKVAFPAGMPSGFLTLRVPGAGPYPYSVYLSRSVALEVRRTSDGARMAESSSPVPPVCDRIGAVTRVTLYGGESYDVRISGESSGPPPFELYLEREGGSGGRDGGACRTSGACTSDAECCDYCHDGDHCH